MRSSRSTRWPAMRMPSCLISAVGLVWTFMPWASIHVIERDVEDVEIAQLPVVRQHHLAVGDHRHGLLGDPAMRAQRLGQAGQVVPRAAGAEHLVNGRYRHDVADPVRRQLETTAGFVT